MANRLGVKKLALDEKTLKVKLIIRGTETELDMAFNLNEAEELRHNAEAFAAIVARYAELVLGG